MKKGGKPAKPAGSIRVLCVDDHVEIRRLFELVLKDQQGIEIVGMADSAEELEKEIEAVQAEVVVMDISMPGRNPVEAMRDAKAAFPEVRFLMASSYDDPGMIERVLQAGANGYLVKGTAFDELAESIRRVRRDEQVLPGK